MCFINGYFKKWCLTAAKALILSDLILKYINQESYQNNMELRLFNPFGFSVNLLLITVLKCHFFKVAIKYRNSSLQV
jgi:hypothetical protein